MNPQHIAVMSVLGLQTLKPVEVGVMDMANAFLRKADHEPMNIKEFKQVLKEVKTTSATFKDGKMTAKRKLPNLNDKATTKILNGKVIHFYHYPIYCKKGKMVTIEFNYDGNGGIRFEDGTTSTQHLQDTNRSLASKYGVTLKGGMNTSKYAWRIIANKHPEVDKNNIHIKEYMDNYFKG